MLALQREYLEEKTHRLIAEQQLAVQEQISKHGNMESSVVSQRLSQQPQVRLQKTPLYMLLILLLIQNM